MYLRSVNAELKSVGISIDFFNVILEFPGFGQEIRCQCLALLRFAEYCPLLSLSCLVLYSTSWVARGEGVQGGGLADFFAELGSFFDLQCEEGFLVFLECRDIPKRAYFGSDEKGDRKAQCDCSRNTPPFTLCSRRKLVGWCLRTGRVKANCDGREIRLRGKMAGSAANALEQGMYAFASFTDTSLSA